MDVPALEHCSESRADRYPLLMEQMETNNESGHIIDIDGADRTLSSSRHDGHSLGMNTPQHGDRPSSTGSPTYQTSDSLNRLNSRNDSVTRTGDGHSHRRPSPLNSGLWLSVELVVTVGQIVASIVVLALSKNENPQAPLFAWVVGYASGCVATLPILYWRYRYRYRNQGMDQNLERSHQGSSQSNPSVEPTSYTAISITQASEEEDIHGIETSTRNSQLVTSSWLDGLGDHFKMALDCFFAVWFVVGNVWIFGGHSSASDAPKLYRLCIVFLTFSCIGYAMPFILCATICCCWPCMTSILGIQEDISQTRGATPESINALPTYKFKLEKIENGDHQELNSAAGEGGILATGTGKEHTISGEDAVCCICLAKYADNDDLRELPCSHLFHMECVDKWLNINALCPLCKCEVGERAEASPLASNSSRHLGERRVGNGSAEGGIYL